MLPEPPSPVLYQICLPPKPFCSCLLACFFFPNNNSTLLFFLSLSPTADVTQIRGHIRSSPSPSPLRLLHCIFFSRGKISALSSLADSRRIACTKSLCSETCPTASKCLTAGGVPIVRLCCAACHEIRRACPPSSREERTWMYVYPMFTFACDT